jgi:acetylglutamate kinase
VLQHPLRLRGDGGPAATTDRPLVIKLGGAAIETPDEHPFLWDALARLCRARPRSLILVHGGGAAIDDRLRALGKEPVKRDGIRITPPDQIDEVVAVLRGIANTKLVGALRGREVPAAGLCLADGALTRARITTRFPFDAGLVGEILSGDPSILRALLSAGLLPVIAPIACDDAGRALNVNADEAAAAVARLVRAEALVLLTDVPGVLDETRRVIPELSCDAIESLIARHVIHSGMIPKVRGALEAARAANAPAIIAPWNDPGTFDKLAHGKPVGTRISPVPTPSTT